MPKTLTRVEVPIGKSERSPRALAVLALLIFSILFSLIAIVVAAGNKKAITVPPAPKTYRAQAQLVLDAWLAGKPSPLPVASGLQPDLGHALSSTAAAQPTPPPVGALSTLGIAFDKASFHTLAKRSWVVDDFFVTSGQGNTWVASVLLLTTPSGPVVGTYPALATYSESTTPPPQLTYANIYSKDQTTLNPGEQAQIVSWAQAFVTNDRTSLYTLTGDTANVHFDGLTGFKPAGQPTILSATKGSDSVLVDLTLPVEIASDPSTVLTLGYDVLLFDVTKPFPDVVAWGPAGTGLSLSADENARPGAVLPSTS